MSRWSRSGARVELLTVLGCDPGSTAPAGGWDARGGFASEGDSARARREEDAQACEVIGAHPKWLDFGSVDYERHGNEADVAGAVASALAGSDRVLLPGFPLTHPDHEWLVRTLLAHDAVARERLAFYAEQPYAARAGAPATAPAWLDAPAFATHAPGLRDRVAKWRAIRCYRSQLPLLALRGLRRGPHVAALAPELVTGAV